MHVVGISFSVCFVVSKTCLQKGKALLKQQKMEAKRARLQLEADRAAWKRSKKSLGKNLPMRIC
jgi:hypothetical protein